MPVVISLFHPTHHETGSVSLLIADMDALLYAAAASALSARQKQKFLNS